MQAFLYIFYKIAHFLLQFTVAWGD